MNNDSQNRNNTHTRLPIFIQFAVLMLILAGMFSSLLFKNNNKTETVSVPENTISNSTANSIAPIVPQKIDNVQIVGRSAFVWDVQQQRVLFQKNEDLVLPLASITKLMTSLLAYELTADDTQGAISDTALRQDGDSGFFTGELFSTGQLRELSLVSSSNDAAFALAATVGQLLGNADPSAQFVTGMNIRAAELGLETLDFKNVTGLDVDTKTPGAVGSARDVSFLMEYIVTRYPELLVPTRDETTRVYNNSGSYHDIENTNEIVNAIPNLIGSKTGFTDLAGGNLTVAFDIGLNRVIIVTVLGSTREGRFDDVLSLVAAVQDGLVTNN